MKEEDKLVLYEALYNPMVHESTAQTLSIHRTLKGAEMAIEFHKEENRKKWLAMFPTEEERIEFPFGHFEWWGVSEITVEE